MKKKQIKVLIKNHYGADYLYIINQPFKDNIAVLTGKKTINNSDIEALINLGFIFDFTTKKYERK